jgi:hypothetical protein
MAAAAGGNGCIWGTLQALTLIPIERCWSLLGPQAKMGRTPLSLKRYLSAGAGAMLKIEVPMCLVVTLLLTATTAIAADVARELAHCELEADRLYPAPDNRGIENCGRNWQPIYKNGPSILNRVCGRLAMASRPNVLFPSRPLKAA